MTETLRSSSPKEGIFRLLVPASDTVSAGAASIDVAGERWQVVDRGAVPSPANAPKYICVSYSWTQKGTPNPFDPERPMSARAQPALQTATAALRPPAIWLDAACVPSQEPARSVCLQNMGAIYAAASGVLAVLSSSASIVLETVGRAEALGPEQLRLLEGDEWVSRAWTYQEMVNSKMISFVAEGIPGNVVGGHKLLNAIGHSIDRLRRAEQVDAYEFHQTHPRLSALESLIDDWLRADSAQRSAYRIMTAMVGRTADSPVGRTADDYFFYAMIGAISSARPEPNDAELDAAEYFMRICEEKGDFSFVYSSAPRASDDVGSWRPKPGAGPMPPLVPWPSVGERQTGELRSTSLHLHNMARAVSGHLDGAARAFIQDWLQRTVGSSLPPDIGDAVYETLHRVGFTGCREYLETVGGLFFPQNQLGDASNCVVFAATDIFFNFGAPAVLLDPDQSGSARLRDVGVFVGEIPKNREKETVIIE